MAATWPSCHRRRAEQAGSDKLIDAAVEVVAQLKGVAVALPSAGGAAGGAVVDSAALDAFAEKVTGSNGVLAATARFVLNELGVAAPAPEESEDENAAVVAAVEAELGSDWPKQVAPRFDANKAILFDDRWLPPAKTSPAPTTTTIPPP